MKRTVILISMVAATLGMSITATAQAQNTQGSEFKRRILEQIKVAAEKTKAPVTTVPEDEAAQSIQVYSPKNVLAGTWDLIITFSDGSNVRSTLQIMPGAGDGEGSALHASEFSLAPPSPTLPEQGSWRYLRGDQFVASYFGYSFDEKLQPFGRIGFRHIITINFNPNYFTGRAVFEVIDLEGHVLFSDNVKTFGVRHKAVAP